LRGSEIFRSGTSRIKTFSFTFILLLSLAAGASGQNLTGTVKNGTTNKPSAGDEVILIKLAEGMEETGHTRTDARGNFTLTVPKGGEPHLVRVVHQGVTYHRMAPPASTSVEVEVYDVAKKVAGITLTADVMRLQAQANVLEGIRLFAVGNASNPPRTQMNDQNFEFYLPDGAQVDQAMAMTSGGQPVNSPPVPQKEKNRYAFNFPLRPGETQFQVVYHLPYSGTASIDPKPIVGAQHFVVMLPKSMQFVPVAGADFKSMQDPRQSDAVVQVVSNTRAGQTLAFKISGTGTLTEAGDDSQGSPTASGPQTAGAANETRRDMRPGGGLGPPIDAPDPLERYRWPILGGFAVILAAGAIYIATRSKTVAVNDVAGSGFGIGAVAPAARAIGVGHSRLLLEALKEELFQLEVEHKQNRISGEEYAKAKDALDETLRRALQRDSAKAPS
jgi:hypothetical protein